MPFCGECGAKLAVGALFCGECGAKQPGAPPAQDSAPQRETFKTSTYLEPEPQLETLETLEPVENSLGLLSAGEALEGTAEERIIEKKLAEAPKRIVEADMDSLISSTQYKVKAANRGITKHVTKLWEKGLKEAGSDKGISIDGVYQYMASPEIMNDYQIHLNKMESAGYGLQSGSKRVQTAQAWFLPSSQEELNGILQYGFAGVSSLSFYLDPVQCIKDEHARFNTLLQCRIILARVKKMNGKIILDHADGALAAYLVEYHKGN